MADTTYFDILYRIAADISGLSQGVEKGVTQFDKLGTTARRVGGALSAAFAGLQIKQAATEVISFTDHLTDLAAKSGLTTDAVQELDFVAKQSGSSFDTISQALALMGDRLVGGDKSTVGALNTLGLTLDDLRAMAPDQAFQAIATAIANIEDPMQRSNVAMDLFGKSGAQLLPVLTSDISGLRDRAQEMGLVMGQDVVAAGAALDDKMEELDTRMQSMKANALLPLLSTFMELPQWMQTGGVVMMNLLPTVASLGTAFALLAGPTGMAAVTGFLSTVLLPLLAPAGAVIAAIGAVYFAWKYWDKIVEIAQYVYTGVKTWIIDNLAHTLLVAGGPLLAPIMGVVAVWQNWDRIVTIAQNVYTGIKTWLVDKFQAVVDSIKAKVEAVTGFFGNMYDKVVGKSYVPDMIRGIASEFGKLDGLMVNPTKVATDKIGSLFKSMSDKIVGMVGGPESTFGKLMSSGLGALFAGPLGSIVSAGVNKLVGLAWAGVKKIGGFFKGLFKKQPNDERDAFFNEFGGLEGVNQAAEAAGDTDLTTTQAIFNAKTQPELDSAIGAWMDRTGRTSIPHLAAGGLVRQPTLAMVGESGPELVTPLRDLDRMGFDGAALQAEVQGLRRDLTKLLRVQPQMTIAAWKDALSH